MFVHKSRQVSISPAGIGQPLTASGSNMEDMSVHTLNAAKQPHNEATLALAGKPYTILLRRVHPKSIQI